MPHELRALLANLDHPLGIWLAVPVGLASALALLAALLLLQGLLFAVGLQPRPLHDALRRLQRLAQGLALLVVALGCLLTATLGLLRLPYGAWLSRAPLAALLPIGFHAAGLLLWVLVALILVRVALRVALARLHRELEVART